VEATVANGVERPAKRDRPSLRLLVRRTERLTPHMIRVVLGGEDIAKFADNGYADRYVKLQFPDSRRTYTVRDFDPAAGELTIDFVYHGDHGLAGPWAANAKPGDELTFSGPGGAYAPAPAADWHLLVGDESALPAISNALEALPAGVPARVFILVDGPAEEQKIDTDADARITWLHRESGSGDLAAAVRGLEFLPGTVHAFVHGEAGFVAELRRHLRDERGIGKDLLSISGYWRRGKNEDGWRAEKAEMRQAEEAAAPGA
jgi:NADPH-dependent ferric siderophore reductase